MVIDSPNLKFLLFMEPTLEQKSKIPINDEITLLIRMASQDCITGTSNYDELGKQEAIFYRGKIYVKIKIFLNFHIKTYF